MSVPRMNWKTFISKGILEPADENSNVGTRVSCKAVSKNQEKNPPKEGITELYDELERLYTQNNVVLETCKDKKNPFYGIAREFLVTQAYDSHKLVTNYQNLIKKKDLDLNQSKELALLFKRFDRQIKKLEKFKSKLRKK